MTTITKEEWNLLNLEPALYTLFVAYSPDIATNRVELFVFTYKNSDNLEARHAICLRYIDAMSKTYLGNFSDEATANHVCTILVMAASDP